MSELIQSVSGSIWVRVICYALALPGLAIWLLIRFNDPMMWRG